MQIAINYLAAMSLVLLAYGYYQLNPYYQNWFSSTHTTPFGDVTDVQILNGLVFFYALFLIPYYMTLDPQIQTKSRLVWRSLLALPARTPSADEKVALLSTAVKWFFLPMMAAWLFANTAEMWRHGLIYWEHGSFFPSGYWLIFNAILVLDVFFFVIAYAIEHPRLGNEIRSVEPTMLGWIVALICYPPFNVGTNEMLGWFSSDYPQASPGWLQNTQAFCMLLAMGIYVWATVALNLKASNLTHRGIIRHGPYAYVRHPAYIAKNFAWWVGALPIVWMTFQNKGWMEGAYAIICVAAWTYIYYLRAITEERHLLLDPEYERYCRQVPARFIPRFRKGS